MEVLGIAVMFLIVVVTALFVVVALMLRAIAVSKLNEDQHKQWTAQTLGELSMRIHVAERKYQELLQ